MVDLNKQNTLSEKLTLVLELYKRFNDNYGNIIDLNKVADSIKSVEIANDKYSNVPDIIKDSFIHGAKGLYFEDKIYVKTDVEIEILFHEILHSITKEHHGVLFPLMDVYPEEEFNEHYDKYGENVFDRQMEQFDESMTRFITELGIPEVEIEDSYKYGADLIRKYYDNLTNNGISTDFIINMYINGDLKDLEKFKNSFNGNDFQEMLASIERVNNVRYYILTKPKFDVKNENEVVASINEATENFKIRS